jgi:hypothetical protein
MLDPLRSLKLASIATGSSGGYYTSQKPKLLKDFDKTFGKHGQRTLVQHYGDDLAGQILSETRREYEALIPKIPNVGGKENPNERALIQCTWALALHRVLKSRGKTADETGRVFYEGAEAMLRSIPGPLRYIGGRWQFTRFNMNKLKKQASESRKRLYPDDWVWSFVQGDGKEFDWGLDNTECAVVKFFHNQGADELVPYMCRLDFAMSKAMGMGMTRTTTLAEGGEKCDFRFKRGRETLGIAK